MKNKIFVFVFMIFLVLGSASACRDLTNDTLYTINSSWTDVICAGDYMNVRFDFLTGVDDVGIYCNKTIGDFSDDNYPVKFYYNVSAPVIDNDPTSPLDTNHNVDGCYFEALTPFTTTHDFYGTTAEVSNNDFINNKIIGSFADLFELNGTSSFNLSYNYIDGATEFVIANGLSSRVYGNEFYNIADQPIIVANSCNSLIFDGNLVTNSKSGVFCINGIPTITNNVFSNLVGYAMQLRTDVNKNGGVVYNNTITDVGSYGILLNNNHGTKNIGWNISNNFIDNSSIAGIYVDNYQDSIFENNEVYNSVGEDFLTIDSQNVSINNLLMDSLKINSVHDGSFKVSNIAEGGFSSYPEGIQPMNKFVNITNTSLGWYEITVYYEEGEFPQYAESESTIKMLYDDGAEWLEVTSVLDTSENTVTSNTTGQGFIYAPMIEVYPEAEDPTFQSNLGIKIIIALLVFLFIASLLFSFIDNEKIKQLSLMVGVGLIIAILLMIIF